MSTEPSHDFPILTGYLRLSPPVLSMEIIYLRFNLPLHVRLQVEHGRATERNLWYPSSQFLNSSLPFDCPSSCQSLYIAHFLPSSFQPSKISALVAMKISQALSRFILLTYALANTTTTLAKPTYVPPMYDGYVDARSIRPRQPNLLHVDGTILAREERGVDEGDHIESRQWEAVLLLVIVASAIVTSVIAPIIISIEEDDPVSRNSVPLQESIFSVNCA